MAVAVKSAYNKLAGIELSVSKSLVRETALDLNKVIEGMKATLPGYDVRIVDGNHLSGTQHRLRELRSLGDASLPGHTVAALNPHTELIEDLIACEDGHANQKPLYPQLLDSIQLGQCWITDRYYCTQPFLFGIQRQKAYFLIRQHGALQGQLVGRCRREANLCRTCGRLCQVYTMAIHSLLKSTLMRRHLLQSICHILVLDNDPYRHEMFLTAADEAQLHSSYELNAFAEAINADYVPDLICLDHDLGLSYREEDRCPGICGCDAADLVVEFVPKNVPVLIHSSNTRCAKIMRQILINGGRSGKVSTVNTVTVSSHSDEAGIQALREAMEELVNNPSWPEALSPEELLLDLGDVSSRDCPVRASRQQL